MTKTYTAYFYTDAEYASTDIEADTPEQALAAALLRMAAPDLREALEFCDMTLADLEASKRKGYIALAKKLARAALAKATAPAKAPD